jgi:hypothetical protein
MLDGVVGTQTPFCRFDPGGQVTGGGGVIGTQIPFCSTEFGPQMLEAGLLLFSTIIQWLDCLNICLPLPKMLCPLFSQGCPKVEEILKVNSISNTNSEATISAEGLTNRVFKSYYKSNASQKYSRK